MTYKNNFVAVVKSNGAVLRERDGFVSMPFGTEYELLLKNLDSRRAKVGISIDGKDVLDGRALVIDGDSETALGGFLKSNAVRNRFRFIKKTKEIVEHRGDRLDDGIIRIECTFEKKVVEEERRIRYRYDDYWYPRPRPWRTYPYEPYLYYWTTTGGTGSLTITGGSSTSSFSSSGKVLTSSEEKTIGTAYNASVQPNEDEGITVKGSEVRQDFQHSCIGELEEASYVITIRLRGTDSKGVEVEKPITIKTKLECSTCGRSNKSNLKFCGNCGTCLI